MECGNEVRCVCYVGGGLPRVLVGAISPPFDEILQLSAGEAAIEDIFYFVFFFAIDDDWFWRRRCLSVDLVTPPWRETVDVEYGVNLERCG